MRKLLLYTTLLLLIVMPAHAQGNGDETNTAPPHPLLEMLALVPDTPSSRTDFLYYLDFNALEAARRTPVTPTSISEFNALEPERRRSYMEAMQRIIGGNGGDLFSVDRETMQEVVGFDFFDIVRMVGFGQPPSAGVIFGGDFDQAAIGAAHAARDYTEEQINGFTAWCGPGGCDSGQEAGLDDRNRGNIFDPALGRKPPVLLLPGYVANSPDLAQVEGIAAAANNDVDTIAQNASYRTLAQAVTAPDGELVQVNFLSYDPMSFDVDLTVFATPEDYEAASELPNVPPILSQWLDYGDLPAFRLMALADRQVDETQVAMIALLYTDADDARAAAEEVAARMETFNGAVDTEDQREPFLTQVAGAQIDAPYVYESADTGLYAAVVSVSYPLPEEEGAEVASLMLYAPGMMYRWWMQTVYMRAFYVVAQVTLPEWATTP